MAGYAYRSFSERQKIQAMVEAGKTAKDISTEMGISLSAVYCELKRGRDGTRYAMLRKRINVCLQSAPLACRRFKLKSAGDGRER